MARRTPPDRLEKQIAAAAEAFVEHGFQRTQMDDIAARLGVSKGTVYRSVDSEKSHCWPQSFSTATSHTLPDDGALDTVNLAQLSSTVRDQLAAAVADLQLGAAVAAPPRADHEGDIGDDVERLALDLYTMMAKHRVRVMVLDQCATEVPALAGDWYDSGRYALVDLWATYLDQQPSQLDTGIEHDMLARTIVEIITLWAVKMPWDPAPRPYPANRAAACTAMIRNLTTGAPS